MDKTRHDCFTESLNRLDCLNFPIFLIYVLKHRFALSVIFLSPSSLPGNLFNTELCAVWRFSFADRDVF